MVRSWLGRLRVRLAYRCIYSLKPVRERGFFTAGYWPALPGMLDLPALRGAPAQANLHEFALRQHPGPRPAPRAVLDIGCGPGGGLLYAHAAFPGARLTGVDNSGTALRAARRRLKDLPGLTLRRATGDDTRLPPHGFDLILSIGAVNAIGPDQLLRECARLLAPGGVVSLTAVFALVPSAVEELFRGAAERQGLAFRSVTEITGPTRAALDHDRPWLEALVRRLPPPLRGPAREYAALPGSRTAEAMATGRLRSYAILLDHPAAAWTAPLLPIEEERLLEAA